MKISISSNVLRLCFGESFFFLDILYLFHELVVVLFNLHADRHLRELLEHIFQPSELPVCAAAVVT